jgi:hypothetical protein
VVEDMGELRAALAEDRAPARATVSEEAAPVPARGLDRGGTFGAGSGL